MRYKTMKKSGEKISAITVGTWAIGGKNSMGGGYGEIDDQDSIEAIKAMIDGGVNLIDTAPIYGEGHSEEVVGKAIEGIRDKVLIATKYGSYIEDGRGVHCSRPDSVLREFDASLKRLNTDYVDMYLMHWPDDLGTPIEDTMACVNKLKEQAEPIYEELSKYFSTDYDTSGSIGKRYRRQDEIGTPFCVCVDFDTAEDHCVTIRDRDTMEQIRLPLSDVREYINSKLEF